LSEVLPGLENVKDASRRSFPGDHAMTLFLLCGFIFWLTKSIPFRIVTVVVTVFFTLPRLISGGHWLTDLLMGSLPIAIFALTIWISVYSVLENYFTKSKT
jgi:membrane-associated phospholipid phosphatase